MGLLLMFSPNHIRSINIAPFFAQLIEIDDIVGKQNRHITRQKKKTTEKKKHQQRRGFLDNLCKFFAFTC